jgi:heterodisulfide reductase subunit C
MDPPAETNSIKIGCLTPNPDEDLGEDFHRCFHCRCCGSGCPFIIAMDRLPNNIIRLLQYGLIEDALRSSTIWVCVACNTCSMECPMAIDIAALMDKLRHLSLKKGVAVTEPDVLKFHKTVLDSISRYGRAHKLDIMMRYKVTTRRWLQDWQVGLKMLAKRKLELLPSRVQRMDEIKALYISEFASSARETSDD